MLTEKLKDSIKIVTLTTKSYTIPSHGGITWYTSETLNEVVPEIPGYKRIAFLSGYPNGNTSVIVQSNGWAHNTHDKEVAVTITHTWLFTKN